MGTVAPAPAKSINGSYNPKPSKIAPKITKMVSVTPGLSLKTSNSICPMTQIVPPPTTAQNNIIGYHFLTQSRLHGQCRGWNHFAGHLTVNAGSLLRRPIYGLIAALLLTLKNGHKQRPLNWLFRLLRREPADLRGKW